MLQNKFEKLLVAKDITEGDKDELHEKSGNDAKKMENESNQIEIKELICDEKEFNKYSNDDKKQIENGNVSLREALTYAE